MGAFGADLGAVAWSTTADLVEYRLVHDSTEDKTTMSADSDSWQAPNEPAAFESLCLDLWRQIWGDPGAQKNGRSGQAQAGVDVFGVFEGRQMGIQCKQKDGLLRTRVTARELEEEVEKALGFQPPLDTFILATSGPRDAKVQKRARVLSRQLEARVVQGRGLVVERDLARAL